MDKSAPSAGPGRRPSHRFSDPDRARALETRRQRKPVETALKCNACHVQNSCPAFKAGSFCTIVDTFNTFEIKKAHDLIAKLEEIISELGTRVGLNYYFEQLDGGKMKKEVSAMFRQRNDYLMLLLKLYEKRDQTKDLIILDPDSLLGKIFSPRGGNQS